MRPPLLLGMHYSTRKPLLVHLPLPFSDLAADSAAGVPCLWSPLAGVVFALLIEISR